MTELAPEVALRRALAAAHVTAALVAAGTAPGIARHVANSAKYEGNASGVLIEIGEHRAVDTPESLGELVKHLLTAPAAAAGAPAVVDDPASNETARAAGHAAGQAQKAVNTSDLAFR